MSKTEFIFLSPSHLKFPTFVKALTFFQVFKGNNFGVMLILLHTYPIKFPNLVMSTSITSFIYVPFSWFTLPTLSFSISHLKYPKSPNWSPSIKSLSTLIHPLHRYQNDSPKAKIWAGVHYSIHSSPFLLPWESNINSVRHLKPSPLQPGPNLPFQSYYILLPFISISVQPN